MMKGRALPVNQIKDFLKSTYKDNRVNIDGYEYIKDLSNETTAVFYNPSINKAVVAHRGTRGFLDWGNNIAYLKGVYKLTPRYRQGRDAQRKAEQRYGRENIETLGHSQGAVLARELGRKTKNIIQVNPSYLFEKKGDNETIIRSSGDVVSRLSKPDITIPSQSSNPIEEHKLNILDRLPANQLVGRSILRKKKNIEIKK